MKRILVTGATVLTAAVLTAAVLAAAVLAARSAWAQADPGTEPGPGASAAAVPALEDSLPGLSDIDMSTQDEVESLLRGDMGENAGDLKEFEIRTDDDIAALEVGDLYKNEETAYKIVGIKRKSAKGGLFTAQRIAGLNDPQRRWTRISGSGPKSIITRMTLLDFYVQGGPFMHPIALLFLAMLVLAINDSLLYRVKAQCPPEFVTAAEAALRQGNLSRFEELARSTKGLMPFICRQMTLDFDESSIGEIRNRVEAATITHVNRMRVPVRALNLIAVSSPLLGLMGTITGMVTVFEGIAGSGSAAKASILAAGIRVALFTTIAGLTVAIPALYAYFILNQKHGAIVGACESIHERFLHLLGKIKRARGQGGNETEEDVRQTTAPVEEGIAVVSRTHG